MIIRIYFTVSMAPNGGVSMDLVDLWYKENYWTTENDILGVKTAKYTYNQGKREAIIWDGAGSDIIRIMDFDYPPFHLFEDRAVSGRLFCNLKGRSNIRYGLHTWYHYTSQDTIK